MSNDAPAAGGPSPAKSIQDFFGWIRSFGIYRPSEDRWGAGVAVGLSRRWGIDPILVRGVFVALAFAGGLGVAAYGIAWLLLPQQDGRIHLQQAMHGHFTAGFVGAVLLSLALFGDPGPGDHFFAGPPRFLALLFLIGLIWWMHRHQEGPWRYQGPPPPVATPDPAAPADGPAPEYGSPEYRAAHSVAAPPVPPPADVPAADPGRRAQAWTPPEPRLPDPSRSSKRITRTTLGLALITGALVGLIASGHDSSEHPAPLIAAAAALAVIAAGVMVAGFSGRRSGALAFFGFLLAAVVLTGTGAHSAGVRAGQNTAWIGQYTWTPDSVSDARQQFNLGLGEAELRLTDPAILTGASAANPLRVSVRMGAGHLTVVTPGNVPATVNVRLGAGDLYGPGGTVLSQGSGAAQDPDDRNDGDRNSPSVRRSTHVGPAGASLVVVDVRQGAGQIDLATSALVTAGPGAGSPPATPTPSVSVSATASKEKSNA